MPPLSPFARDTGQEQDGEGGEWGVCSGGTVRWGQPIQPSTHPTGSTKRGEHLSAFETKPDHPIPAHPQAKRWLKSRAVPMLGSAHSLKPGEGLIWFPRRSLEPLEEDGGSSAEQGQPPAPCRMLRHLRDAGRRESQRRGEEGGRGSVRSCLRGARPFLADVSSSAWDPLEEGDDGP